jgi:hypothetical protein
VAVEVRLRPERPWTLISAGDYVAIGTSPKNSQTDGAGAGAITSLAYRDGILYGGSMNCCTAATPSDGKLFALDVTTGAKLWEIPATRWRWWVTGWRSATPTTTATTTSSAYDYGSDFRYHVWLSGSSYTGSAGWYDSGAFDLATVNGRLVMGIW